MESIGITLELTPAQIEELRSALGAEFNIAEVLSAWASKRLKNDENLNKILSCFDIEELMTLRFKEFNIPLSEEIRIQINKWPDHSIDALVFEILKQLTKRDPKTEFLSQTEVDEMLLDIMPGSHSNGPSGLFNCHKLFNGSGPKMELVAVQVVIRAYLFDEIGKIAKSEGCSSVEELIQQKILAFSPVVQKS